MLLREIKRKYRGIMVKTSHRRCCIKKCSYKFRKISRKTSVPILFFNKVPGLKEILTQVFPVNFAKFVITPLF